MMSTCLVDQDMNRVVIMHNNCRAIYGLGDVPMDDGVCIVIHAVVLA